MSITKVNIPVKQSGMSSSATLYAVGKIAYLYASFYINSALSASDVLYEIPAGYRPKERAKLAAMIRLNTNANAFMLNDMYVDTNGNVYQNATNNNYGCMFFGMWEIA